MIDPVHPDMEVELATLAELLLQSVLPSLEAPCIGVWWCDGDTAVGLAAGDTAAETTWPLVNRMPLPRGVRSRVRRNHRPAGSHGSLEAPSLVVRLPLWVGQHVPGVVTLEWQRWPHPRRPRSEHLRWLVRELAIPLYRYERETGLRARMARDGTLADMGSSAARSILSYWADARVDVDDRGVVVDSDDRAGYLFGYPARNAVVGAPFRSLFSEQPPLTPQPFNGGAFQRLLNGITCYGDRFPCLVLPLPHPRSWDHVQVLLRDVAALRHVGYGRRLPDGRSVDSVTGLAGVERARRACQRGASEQRGQASTHLGLVEIDHRRWLIDTYGTLALEGVLAHVARVLGVCSRSCDTLAQLDRGRFVLVLPAASRPEAQLVLAQLRACVRELAAPTAVGDLHATVSISCERCPSDRAFDEALESADATLQQQRPGFDRVIQASS